MKNLKFNFKSIVQTKARWLLTFCALLTLGVGQVWADAQFDEVYMTYTINGSDGNYTFNQNSGHSDYLDGVTITTDFIITNIYLKYRNYNGNMCGGQLGYKLDNGSWSYYGSGNDNALEFNWKSNSWWYGSDKIGCELYKENCNLEIASASDASGVHSITMYWQMWGRVGDGDGCGNGNWYFTNNGNTNGGGGNFVWTYTILPPDLEDDDFTVTPSNYVSGTGTEDDPFIIANNSSTAFTVSATQAHTDANSALWVKFGDGSYSSTTTSVSYAKSASKTSLTISAKYYNDGTTKLSGTEVTKTIWYQEQPAGITVAAGDHGKVSIDGSSYGTSKVITPVSFGTAYNIYAQADEHYDFDSWSKGTNSVNTTINTATTPNTVSVSSGTITTITANFVEHPYTITIVGGTEESTTAGVSTTTGTATANPPVGYHFTGWTIPGSNFALVGCTTSDATITFNATAAGTVTANFARTYAYIEGRFHVTNAERNGTWTNTFSDGNWNENSVNIPFEYDEINHRFFLHTHAKPAELTSQISSLDPFFFIKLSKSSSDVTGDNYYTHYWSATSQTLSAAGTANKKTLVNTGTFYNAQLKFNSSDESGYAVIYFDGSHIWYELEQRLQYDGNTSTGGSAPATHNSYYKTGTNATAASNTYTKTGYYFTGWKTEASGGTSYAAGASVPMSADVTLYAQWSICQATITFNADGGSEIANKTATYGSAMPSITKPTKAGYVLVGIYDAADGGTQYYDKDGASARTWDKEDASTTLYVRWAQEFSVSIAAKKDEAVISEYTPVSPVTANTTLTIAVSAPVIPGYDFSSWTLDGNLSSEDATTANPISITATADATLTANYTYHSYDITYPDVATAHCVYGAKDASVSYKGTGGFTVTPAAGYSIAVSAKDATEASVTIYKNGDNYTFVQGTSPVTIIITPSENTNTITIVNGKVTGGDATEVTATVATTSASVTADAAPEGKKFLTWSFGPGILLSGCDTTSQSITFNATQSTTITATYTNRSKKTVHFAKPYGWSTVTAKFYQDATAKTEEVTAQSTFTYEGATYYTFWYYTDNNGEGDDKSSQAAWNKVVFSNNGSDALVAKTINDGYYYAKGAEEADGRETPYAEWYLRGNLNSVDNWNSNHYDRPFNIEGTSATFAFGATIAGDQFYRIYRISTGEWFRYGTENSDLVISIGTTMTLSKNGDNADKFTSEMGVYLFTLTNINSETPSLTVTHPEDTKSGVTITSEANGSLGDGVGEITQLGRYMPTAISATANAGYRFKEWVATGGVVVDDPTSASTTATATADGTLTATFTNKYIVYLDLSSTSSVSAWNSTPYVYFYSGSYWDNNKGSGSKNILWGGQAMTRIGSSNIWYYDYSGTKLVTDSKQYIAFTDGDRSGQNNFDAASVIYRSDYYPDMNMYVLVNYIDHYLNEHGGTRSCYYEQGYWMKYREEQPGYNLRIYDGQGRNLQETVPFRTANIESRDEYTATFHVDGAAGAKLELIGHDQGYVNGINYTGSFYGRGGTINSSLTNWDWALSKDGGKFYINFNTSGDYVFGLSCGTDGKLHFKVTFPISVGDFRIKYDGLVTTDDVEKSNMYSDVIPHLTADGTRKDTVSFFVTKTNDNDLKPALSLEECTAINTPNAGDITWSSSAKGFSGDAISSLESGVYLFEIVQTRTSGTISFTYTSLGEYHGNYYVRTDWADGGWVAFKQNQDNLMPATNYASAGYTNYHCHYVPDGSVKFCVANKYNSQLSNTIVDDDYNADNLGGIESSANTRFEYDTTTNVVSRSYIGASNVPTFLYIKDTSEPDKIYKDNGTTEGVALTGDTAKFIDNENWIYTLEVKAKPRATYKLEAKINDNTQYFVGSELTSETLIGGSGDTKYKMRLVYDYKNNHLIKAFIPDGVISSDLTIEADLMIIREHQGEAQQINFSESGKLSEVQTVYGAMKFNKWTVNGKEKTSGHAATSASQYERDLFWISFPFDVKLSEAFGFGEYGTHWIIEYYDGKGRAKNGFWADSPSNWKFVYPSMRDTFKLKAFEGYILALDLDSMKETSSVWKHGVEDVYVYFPSSAEVKDIQATSRTVNFVQTGYKCTINRGTTQGDRRIKDSYWHCIGVPSYANTTNLEYSDSNIPGSIDTESWEPGSTLYFYEWNSASNTLSIHTSSGYDFQAMHSYLVQYAGSSLIWSTVNVTPAASVAARVAETEDREYKLVLQSEERTEDQTYIRLTDDANVTTGFEFNYDLSKEMNKNCGNIYTMISSTIDNVPSITEAAANVQPKPVQTTVVPVGVKVVANGEYTLSMPEGTNGEDVYLIDNAYGTRTNLGLMPYTVTLTAGTYDSRFALEFGPIQDAPTSLENDANANADVRKVFVGGRLYIIRDGKVFDATGHRVE